MPNIFPIGAEVFTILASVCEQEQFSRNNVSHPREDKQPNTFRR